ncbi:MAG TPA: hypothetical protein PKI05_16375, partial [Thermogutta sp.]|nr:hypothetical protein [Thermogutta sp.]
MSKSIFLTVIACGLLAGLICVASENPQKAFNSSQLSGPGNFFVAPNGNDKWSGCLPAPNQDQSDGPWATLEHARDVLRKLRAERDFREGLPKTITVWVRGGVYWLSRPLVFEAEDSGKSGSPVTYRA